MKTIKFCFIMFFSVAIASCGGGGSAPGAGVAPGKVFLSGTIADGPAIANVTATIKDRNGSTRTVTTGTDGKYTIDVTGMTAPFLLRVPAGTGYLYSVATATGTANIHPFTDLIIRNWYKVQSSDVDTDFSGTSALAKIPTVTEINTIEAVARNILSANLANAGVTTSNFNLLTSSFDANHTGFGKVLDNTRVTVSTSGTVTVTATDPVTGITGTMVSTDLTTDLTAADTTKPSDPSGLSPIPASTVSMVVVWNASTDNVGVAGYNIYRAGSKIGTSPYPVYSDTGLSSSTLYCYQVEAFDGAGNVSAKSPATPVCATTLAVADSTPPSAPTGLTATTASASQVNLSWAASTDNVGVAGYAIYRGGVKVAAVNGLIYSDTGLSSGTLYSYTVKALDGALNYSVDSNTASATTPAGIPSAPTGITATAGNGQVTISWNAVGGASSYNLYMATQSGVTRSNYSTLTGGMTHTGVSSPYVHTGLANGTTYYFIVTAVNASESVESAQVTATPAAATASNYAGTYSGTITVNGISSGTFNMIVDSAGAMTGSISINSTTGTLSSGQVTTSGIVTFMLSGKTDSYSGTINAATGAFSATCTSGCIDSVTYTGTKQTAGVGAKFPIATTTAYEISISAAFDGTNYLVAIGTDQPPAGGGESADAQFISQSGTALGSLKQGGGSGGSPNVAYDGSNYLLLGEDCTGGACFKWGKFVSPSGTMGSNFTILPANTYGGETTIAYGGGSYLEVYSRGVSNLPADGYKVYGRLILPSSTVGNEIAISSAAGGFGETNPISNNIFFAGNNFLVVWDTASAIMGRFVSPSGTLGTEFTIRSRPTSVCRHHNPIGVAFDGTNYLVVWHEDASACLAGGSGIWDLMGQMVTTSGTTSGNVISVSTASGTQFYPQIAFDGTNYLVSWTDMRNDANNDWICDSNEGTCMDIYGQYISKSGTLVGSELVINNDAGNQFGGVAGFANGKYLAIINDGFTRITNGFSNNDVYGVFITP